MATKTTKTTGIEDTLAAIVRHMQVQDARIASLIDTKASVKAKAVEAKPAAMAPEFQHELVEAKYGTGIAMTFNGRKSSRFLYVNELRILAKHIDALLGHTKHVKG